LGPIPNPQININNDNKNILLNKKYMK